MRVTLNAKDLARAIEAGILSPGQDAALLAFLNRDPPHADFQLAHVAYYFGAMLVMGALGWLLTTAWMDIGDGALLAVASLYFVAFLLCAFDLRRRGHVIPGGLLAAVAVSLTPLVVFAFERVSGLWPGGTDTYDYHDYYVYLRGGWLAMEAVTMLVGIVVLRTLPFPFICMPIAVALWFMSMDLTEWLYGSPFGWDDRRWVSLWFGLALLLVSLLVDARTQGDYAFWGYLAGLLAFWGGLSLMNATDEPGKTLYCLANLLLILTAVALRRPVFLVFGALGVAGYLADLSHRVFRDSLLFPIAVTLIGLGVIGAGMLYQRHRDRLTDAIRMRLPASLVRMIPALRR